MEPYAGSPFSVTVFILAHVPVHKEVTTVNTTWLSYSMVWWVFDGFSEVNDPMMLPFCSPT